MLALLSLLACSNEPDCSIGFQPNPDGNCYEDESEPIDIPDDAIAMAYDDFPDCDAEPTGDGTLDLFRRCAGGLCVGMTYDEMVASVGSDADSVDADYDGYLFVGWDDLGVYLWLHDADEDGLPDPDDTTWRIVVQPWFAGTTDDGLGTDMSLACFVDVLGDPDAITFEPDGGWHPASLIYYVGFTVRDYVDLGEFGGDGRSDYLWLDE